MSFGMLPDGQSVSRFTVGSPEGVQLAVLDLGAAVHQVWVPDASGVRANVVLGGDDLSLYLRDPGDYFGAVVGRYANRIAGAALPLDGQVHRLDANDGAHTLHGGADGFHRRLWTVEHADPQALELSMVSPDGDQGFPGRVEARVRYEVSGADVRMVLTAVTDAPTVVNLSQHAHFNLGGEGSGTVEDHLLEVAADRYTPVRPDLVPTGEIAPVQGTPFDLRRARPLSTGLASGDEQVTRAGGYDHNFALDGDARVPAAVLTDPSSGRRLSLHTDQPGLQVYSGNLFHGQEYPPRAGVALEPQVFPDAPHHVGDPGWPSAVLRPGQRYRATTLWRFDA